MDVALVVLVLVGHQGVDGVFKFFFYNKWIRSWWSQVSFSLFWSEVQQHLWMKVIAINNKSKMYSKSN